MKILVPRSNKVRISIFGHLKLKIQSNVMIVMNLIKIGVFKGQIGQHFGSQGQNFGYYDQISQNLGF